MLYNQIIYDKNLGEWAECGTICLPLVLCHRLLNELPATRVTATAVDAFLQVTGFKLYALYGRQFVKMLHYIDHIFLEDLKKVRCALEDMQSV